MNDKLVIVRGGGDIATGTIQALWRAGFAVLVLEVGDPSAIRRSVALCEAVYDDVATVEDMTCRRCHGGQAIDKAWRKGEIPLIIDPWGHAIEDLQPWAVVDAILAKKNLGTTKDMAPHTVALGPGFIAGKDVDVVIETMRGHQLGRIITDGPAMANTGTPGLIAGYGAERVIHSDHAGFFYGLHKIGDIVEKDEPIGIIAPQPFAERHKTTLTDGIPVLATLTGLLRGIIRDAYPVTKGFKIADIDPRKDQYNNCFTISDKARSLGGAVVTALLMLEQRHPAGKAYV